MGKVSPRFQRRTPKNGWPGKIGLGKMGKSPNGNPKAKFDRLLKNFGRNGSGKVKGGSLKKNGNLGKEWKPFLKNSPRNNQFGKLNLPKKKKGGTPNTLISFRGIEVRLCFGI